MSKATKSLSKTRLNDLFASTLAISLLMLISVSAKSTPITFFDGDFSSEDWESFLASKTPNYTTINFGKSQTLTGGIPDVYLSMWHQHKSINSSGVVFYWNNKISYDPHVNGAILGIDYSSNVYWTGANGNLTDGLVLRQENYYFYSDSYNSISKGGGWKNSATNNLTSDNFHPISQEAPLKPDFSSSGSPIQFGYFRRTYVSNYYNGEGIYHGTDNWKVEIAHVSSSPEPVPEPGTLGLFGLGLAGLIFLGRKRGYY